MTVAHYFLLTYTPLGNKACHTKIVLIPPLFIELFPFVWIFNSFNNSFNIYFMVKVTTYHIHVGVAQCGVKEWSPYVHYLQSYSPWLVVLDLAFTLLIFYNFKRKKKDRIMKLRYHSLLDNFYNWNKFQGHRIKGQGQRAKNPKIEGFSIKIDK